MMNNNLLEFAGLDLVKEESGRLLSLRGNALPQAVVAEEDLLARQAEK
jgi:hypothetical protein